MATDHTIAFPTSGNITGASLDPATQILEVAFKGGKRYRYANVTPEMLAEWRAAESAGKWFNSRIKAMPEAFPVVPDGAVALSSSPDPVGVDADPSPAVDRTTEIFARALCASDDEMLAGRVGYEAYIANSGGKTFDGRTCPPWAELGPAVQLHWRAAAVAISALVGGRSGSPDESVVGLERAENARLTNVNESLQQRIRSLENCAARADQEAVDRAAAARTKMLEQEVDLLRTQVAAHEAQALRSPALSAPWHK